MALLAPLTVPRDYLQLLALHSSMRHTVEEITAQIPYHYTVPTPAGTTANAAPAQATGHQDRSVTPLTDQGSEDNEA
jgi:hypothetical protein